MLEEWPESTFLLVGEGPLAGEMHLYTERLGIASNVRFLGWRDDVPAILAAMDICVLASLWEGLPYTLLEAMAAGKPMVATSVGGSREIVVDGETGLLVPPRNPSALARGIMRLLADQALAAEMGRRGRERVHDVFSIEAMLRKTEEVYEKLLQ